MKRTTQMKNAGTPSARDAVAVAMRSRFHAQWQRVSEEEGSLYSRLVEEPAHTLRSLYGKRPTAKYTRRADKRSRRRGFAGSLHEFMTYQLIALNRAKAKLAAGAQ